MAPGPRLALSERTDSNCYEEESVCEHFLAVDDPGSIKDHDVADQDLQSDDQAQHPAHGHKERQEDDDIDQADGAGAQLSCQPRFKLRAAAEQKLVETGADFPRHPHNDLLKDHQSPR